jgi:hypothetical protein
MSEIQRAIVAPARQGFALMAGVRAAVGALKGLGAADRPSRPGTHEDEDPLFIG